MKFSLIATVFLMLFSIAVKAQTNEDSKIDTIVLKKDINPKRPIDTAGLVYVSVESRSEYPGGMQEFYNYLGHHMNIPPQYYKKGIVLVSFIIEEDGSVGGVEILQGIITGYMKKEIIRVFEASPKWKPAIMNNKPTKTQYSVPLSF